MYYLLQPPSIFATFSFRIILETVQDILPFTALPACIYDSEVKNYFELMEW